MSTSPIHVHVQDNTPVHVHVKKPKTAVIRPEKDKPTPDFPGSKKYAKATARSKSKALNGPWIPAPGKTSLRDRTNQGFKWDSGKSQLEVHIPERDDNTALKVGDLSMDEEDRVKGHIRNYEKKIETLMKEVGSLRNETITLCHEIRSPPPRSEDEGCLEEICCEDLEQQEGEFEDPFASVEQNEVEVKEHSLLLTSADQPLDISSERNYKDYHERCFRPPSGKTEADKRIEKAFAKLMKEAKEFSQKSDATKNDDAGTKQSETVSQNSVAEPKPPLEDILHFDRSHRKDFEKGWQNVENEMKNTSETESLKKVRFSQESKVGYDDAVPSFEVAKGKPRSLNIDAERSSTHKERKVELKKIEHELEDREDQLEASKAVLEDQQRELDRMAREYKDSEQENTRLRESVERIKDELSTSNRNIEDLGTTKDILLKKLVEVELDGASCGKQVAALRDVIARLRQENRISAADQSMLTKERELLLQKLEEFEASNRSLRRLLQAQHEITSDIKRLEEHRNTMIQKVADSDATASRLKSETGFLKNELDQVLGQLNEEKNHSRTLTELNKSIDATRAHLQRELRAKEMENNRLHVQLRNLEKDTALAQRDAEDATAAAKQVQETIGTEKEALKKATRAQRQRADKSEQLMREAEGKLAEKESQLASTQEESETWKTRYHRAMDDRARADTQVKSLSNKLDELEAMLRRNENKSRDRETELMEKLHKLTAENATNGLECERLKGELHTANEKLRLAQEDAAGQRIQAQQMETLNSELRAQIAKCKNEAEEALLGAERAEREARRMREQGSDEIERVRKQMLQRMKDLQPLPEILKETEMKLQDAQDQIRMYERRSAEQTRVISELTSKGEQHSDDTDGLRQKIGALTDENRALEARLDIIHTKLNDRDNVLRESAVARADKDENIQSLQLKLEEKTHLCNSLQRQLDAALEEVRKTGEMERDKAAARERAAQARIADLETQLTRAKTDVAGIKRSKVDAERRLQSQLQDARDRLEQSESTNRSMRNYVNFLKSSYNTVFGAETSLTSTPVRGGATGGASPHSPY